MAVKFTVLVNAVVMKGDRALILKRDEKEKHQAEMWCVPGGKLEEFIDFEALQFTAMREVLEETGIFIDSDMRLIANNIFKHREDDTLTVAIVFLTRYISGIAKPLEDTQEVYWVAKDELKDFLFSPNVENYIKIGFDYDQRV